MFWTIWHSKLCSHEYVFFLFCTRRGEVLCIFLSAVVDFLSNAIWLVHLLRPRLCAFATQQFSVVLDSWYFLKYYEHRAKFHFNKLFQLFKPIRILHDFFPTLIRMLMRPNVGNMTCNLYFICGRFYTDVAINHRRISWPKASFTSKLMNHPATIVMFHKKCEM